MSYLDLSPAIAAIRERPDEFEMLYGHLHHAPSRHTFKFETNGAVRVLADCYCAMLSIDPEQGNTFHTAYNEWNMNYWRPIEINREFSTHFRAPNPWRRLFARLLTRLVERLQAAPSGHSMARHSPM